MWVVGARVALGTEDPASGLVCSGSLVHYSGQEVKLPHKHTAGVLYAAGIFPVATQKKKKGRQRIIHFAGRYIYV